MPATPRNIAIQQMARRVPGLRRLPMLRLLALGEVLLMAQQHIGRLTPAERRRAIELVRAGRGRTRNLDERDRAELADLLEKAGGREFVAETVHKVSPVPIPAPVIRRLIRERRRATR